MGKIDGTNAFVGIVTDGEQAEAYVCNGVDFKELFTETMADARDGRLTLMGEDGDLLPINVIGRPANPAEFGRESHRRPDRRWQQQPISSRP